MAGERGGIVPRPYGGVQVVEAGRKLFSRARQGVFLDALAETCNVHASARAAGVTAQCVYQRRRRDAGFRAAWGEALEQGYARLEAMLLAAAMGEGVEEGARCDAAGVPETGPHPARAGARVDPLPPAGEGLDKDLALHLLREHKKGLAGIARPGAAPHGADWAEVEGYFVARLAALRARLERSGEKQENSPSTSSGRTDF